MRSLKEKLELLDLNKGRDSACSAPAVGSPVAGEGQVAHSPDGDGLKSKGDSKLMKKFEVDGVVYDIPEPVDAYIKGLVKTLRYTLDKNDEAYHILSGSNDNLRDAFLGMGTE